MKTIFYSFLLVFISSIFLVACGGSSNSPVGTWMLGSISGEELSDAEKSSTFEIKEDGTFIRKRGDMEREGQWEIVEKDGTRFFIIKDKDGSSEEENEIKSLDGSTFVFMNKGNEITLKKK